MKPISLDKKNHTLGQYVFEDLLNPSEVNIEALSDSIGYFMIAFSRLEGAINGIVAELINDRGDDLGYRVLSFLGVRDKITFLKWTAMQHITWLDVTPDIKKKRRDFLKELITNLVEVNAFRNRVAHASWEYVDEDGYFLTKTHQDSDEGDVTFEKVKFTKQLFYRFTRRTEALQTRVESLTDILYR